MVLKIINGILIVFAVFMGLKQGWAMVSGKPEMLEMFNRWNINKTGLLIMGGFTALSAVLIIFPKTFFWGNFLMAAGILMIMLFHLQQRDLKGFMVEMPFFVLNFLIVYLQHPISKNN